MQPPGAGDRELGCIRGGPALLAFLFSLLPFRFFLTSVFFLAFFLLLPSSSFTSFTSFTFGRVRINRSNRCSICCVPDDHSFLTKINYLTKNMQNANSRLYFACRDPKREAPWGGRNWRVLDDHSFLTKINYLTKNMQNANSRLHFACGDPKREGPWGGRNWRVFDDHSFLTKMNY